MCPYYFLRLNHWARNNLQFPSSSTVSVSAREDTTTYHDALLFSLKMVKIELQAPNQHAYRKLLFPIR